MEQRLRGVDCFGIFRFGECQVKLGQCRHARYDFPCHASHQVREFGQYPADFIPFCNLGFTQSVVEFHHRQRLDKQGCACRGLIVNDGFDLTFEFRPQGNDVPAVALGNNVILQL